MGKNNWLNYKREGDFVEVIIRDYSGGKIESFKFPSSDKKAQSNVARILKNKYGINLSPEIKPKDSINNKNKDMDWLNINKDLF